MRIKTAKAAVAVCALLLFMSLASPAIGGPSIGQVAAKAKLALSTAKKAGRTARSANAKASQALARPVVTPGGITEVTSATTFVASGDAGGAIAFCPAGQRVVSGGGSMISGAADGIAVSQANETATGWFVVAGNNAGITAELTAVAYCAPAGSAVTADRSEDRAALAATVRALQEKLD